MIAALHGKRMPWIDGNNGRASPSAASDEGR